MRIFITGASSGIGAALARHYAAQSAQLGLVGRNQQRLDALASELACDCAVYVADVRDSQSLQHAALDFMQRFGAPDIVIANAGVSSGTLTEQAQHLETFRAIMEINVLGMVHTFQPFLKAMKACARGQLVGIASVAGLRGIPGASAYSASKAAAISYLESLRVELADSGISVTTICPGYIRTPMTDINPYKMPFLMEADVAAQKMARIITKKQRYAILPWQMALLGRFMKMLPAGVWDWAMKKAPYKPHLDWDWL
jgi:short-subunit dehydrogenase